MTSLSSFGSLPGGQLISIASRPSTFSTALRRWNRNRAGFRPIRRKSNLLPNSYSNFNFANSPIRQQSPSTIYNNRQQFIQSVSENQQSVIKSSFPSMVRSKRKSDLSNESTKFNPPRTQLNLKNSTSNSQSIKSQSKQSITSISLDQTSLWMETIRSQLKSITNGAKSFFSSLFNG